jgi:hypothetical protein
MKPRRFIYIRLADSSEACIVNVDDIVTVTGDDSGCVFSLRNGQEIETYDPLSGMLNALVHQET